MKRRTSSQPASSLPANDPLFRNDQAARATERAILRPMGLKAFGISDEDPLFVFKYYRDPAVGSASSGERMMFISFEDFTSTPSSDIVDVEALSRLVAVDEFMEDEGGVMARELIRGIARQR